MPETSYIPDRLPVPDAAATARAAAELALRVDDKASAAASHFQPLVERPDEDITAPAVRGHREPIQTNLPEPKPKTSERPSEAPANGTPSLAPEPQSETSTLNRPSEAEVKPPQEPSPESSDPTPRVPHPGRAASEEESNEPERADAVLPPPIPPNDDRPVPTPPEPEEPEGDGDDTTSLENIEDFADAEPTTATPTDIESAGAIEDRPQPKTIRGAPSPETFAAWQERRDRDSGRRIIDSYTPMVRGIVRRYGYYVKASPGIINAEDLEQEGKIALLRAALPFKPEGGAGFFGYAWPAVRGVIQEVFARNNGAVDIRASGREDLAATLAEENRRIEAGEPPMTIPEQGVLLGLAEGEESLVTDPSARRTVSNFRLWRRVYEAESLEGLAEDYQQPVEPNADDEFIDGEDVVAAGQPIMLRPGENLEEEAGRHITQQLVRQALTAFANATPETNEKRRESAFVIANFFGVGTTPDNPSLSTTQLAELFGVTPTAVFMLRSRALERFRKFIRAHREFHPLIPEGYRFDDRTRARDFDDGDEEAANT